MSNPVYDPTRTFVVDSAATNYLVRGNEPLLSDGKTFAYDELNTQLQNGSSTGSGGLPPTGIGGTFDLTDYSLVDVSVIDDNAEGPLLTAEFTAYGQDFESLFPAPNWPPVFHGIDVTKQYGTAVSGHPGSIVWYPVQGCTDLSNCEQVEPPQFNFIGMIDFLRGLLENSTKTVIYFHCEHGHDRTSAVAGSYEMKYKGKTLQQVRDEGCTIMGHAWESAYLPLIEYYCANYQPVTGQARVSCSSTLSPACQ